MTIHNFIYLIVLVIIITVILLLFCFYKRLHKEIWGKDFIYRCPKCNSTNLGYLCSLSNYIEVFHYNKKPKYSHSFVCHNCGLIDLQDKLIKEKVNKQGEMNE